MCIPLVGSWVKKRNPFTGSFINSRYVVVFEIIAALTGQSEIFQLVGSSFRNGNYVIN